MDYRNMIPGMKVKSTKHTDEYGTHIYDNIVEETYIVRMLKRDDELDDNENAEHVCVINQNIEDNEGNYTEAKYLTILELPKSFSKRNEKYKEYDENAEEED